MHLGERLLHNDGDHRQEKQSYKIGLEVSNSMAMYINYRDYLRVMLNILIGPILTSFKHEFPE